MDITKAIKHLLATKFKDFEPSEINHGNCEDFALELTTLIPEADMYWAEDWFEVDMFSVRDSMSLGHCFVVFKGRFYDSERPEGVDNPLDLPFFQYYGGKQVIEKYLDEASVA